MGTKYTKNMFIDAHYQRAPVTISAKFGRQCRRRAAYIGIMIDIASALVRPTLGLYIDDPIGDGDTSPGKMSEARFGLGFS
ncbi:hypothetical protein B6G00_04835 [Salinivibrio sp. YCSC6]|nr:hypothetical protein B6G00_04835 [Salinivibrio sp. YCSC6]